MNPKKIETYIIEDDDANQRIDTFLSNIYSNLSRSFVQKQIKDNGVYVDEKTVKPSYILKTDDVIRINFETEEDYVIEPQNIELDIRYEDASMLVVNKPSGMLTHPTSKEKRDTLVNALLYKYPDNLSTQCGANRPGIVHRLDRNTSGLLMVAKTNEAYEFLKQRMQSHLIEKKYYTVVSGNIENDEGTINASIGRHPAKPEKMAVVPQGKPSVTHYKVLERFGSHTFLEVTLETGRTHQIRVHMAHIKHPVINDTLYGGAKMPVKTAEQVLQSFFLRFVSPCDMEEHTITIDFDNDIMKTLNYLRSKK